MNFKRISTFIFGFSVIYFLVISLFFNYVSYGEQQFSYLAKSFLSGKTYFTEIPGNLYDTVYWKGKYYWPLAPFPSLLLIPFIYFSSFLNIFFLQGYLQFFLTLGVFYLAFKLASKSGFSNRDSLYLSFAFVFASIYQLIAIVPWSWYFVQAITVLLLFLSIYEYQTKKRFLLIGIYLAAVFASRFTAGLGVIFFLLLIVRDKSKLSDKALNSLKIGLPIMLTGVLLLYYNQIRFGNIFENGYRLTNNATMTEEQRYELINRGLFKLENIPTNFYYYFVKSLDPILVNAKSLFDNTYYLAPPYFKAGYPGVSFFFVSPIFLYMFKGNFKKKEIVYALLTSLVILFFLLTYYWVGWRQVGPRYLLDLLPFWYLILLTSFKGNKLTNLSKTIILVSAYINLYLLGTVF